MQTSVCRLLLFSCFSYFILLPFSFRGILTVQAFTGTYGINYGRIADNIPPPESVVALLKAAKIKNARIYDADHNVLKAFGGSGLELVIGIPNEYLKDMSVNEDRAIQWINKNVQPYLPDTDIRGIAVGNEVLGGSDQELTEALFGALKNVYDALKGLQLADHIEIDAAYAALDAAGYEKMKVRISETGWASHGDKDEAGASTQNARIYNFNLLKRLAKRKGTPRRPKVVVSAYVFALFNEDLKPGPGSEKHYGLLNANGTISYDIGLDLMV